MPFEKHPILCFLFIVVVSVFMHRHVFPLELVGAHSMRQAQTQQNIQLFFQEDFNILNPRVNLMNHKSETTLYRYEFPIMQWSVALVYKITGRSFMVTRIMMFLLGCFSMLGIYVLLKNLWLDHFIAWAGTWTFCFSPIFYFYTMAPMPDNLALCGAIWSLTFLYKFKRTENYFHLMVAAFFASLGTAAKLPFIIFLIAPFIFWINELTLSAFKIKNKHWKIAGIYLLFLAPTFLWYAWVIPTWRNGVIKGIFDNTVSWLETLDILKHHCLHMFPKRLMTTVGLALAFTGIYFLIKRKIWKTNNAQIILACGIVFLFYWIYEFNMIGKVHDYYMLPILPMLYISAAYGIRCLWQNGNYSRFIVFGLIVSMPFVTQERARKYWDKNRQTYNKDVYLFQDDLKNAAPPDAKCIIVNDYTQYEFSYLIDKKAFVFRDDYLPGPWVGDLINRYNISYLYSSSRKVDSDPEVLEHVEKMVMEKGEIKVFKLKN